MHHHTELSFVDEFRYFSPLHYLKTDDRTLLFFGACRKRGCHLYTTTAPSCCIPASYCHLSATLQTINITVVNLQDNRAVFRIFIALLSFTFDSPSCVSFDDEGCVIGLDVCMTYYCNQVLCHAWPVTVRSCNTHFIFRFYQT